MKKIFILLLSVIVVACSSPDPSSDIISLKDGWKIKRGDQAEWAGPQFNDSDWDQVVSGKTWENQDLDQFIAYDGYAWYRISFELPEDIRKFSYFGKFLQLSLGKIDDTEQTYLNGELLGSNNELLLSEDGKPVKFEGDSIAYSYFRNYILPVDDKRINWGGRNVIAIRVHDHGGGGGMSFPSPSVSMVDIKDYFSIDGDSDPYEMLGDHFTKNIRLINEHESEDFAGDLTIRATRYIDEKVIYETCERVEVKANSAYDYIFSFSSPSSESHRIEFIYNIDGAHYPVYEFQGAPYILTPPAPEEPRINGPAVFGVRPDNPLLYTIPVSGNRPIEFGVEGLPEGVVLDSVNGILRGSIRNKGDYTVTLIATNQLGEDRKSFTIKVGDAIQLTPPMEWDGWGTHLHPNRLSPDEQYSHVSLWCLLGAPLLLGNDLSKVDDFVLNLLTNQEVLAINQDALCKQAERILKEDNLQVWVKELSDGSHSIGFFNMDDKVQELEISLGSIGFGGKYKIRDLWRQVDISESAEKIDLQLMPHGVYLVKVDKI